jgi:hypothetical protein
VTFEHVQRKVSPLNVPAGIHLTLGANLGGLARARGDGTHKELLKGGRGDSLRSISNCAEIVMRAAINGMIQPSAWTSAVALAGVKPRTPGGGKVQPVEQSA